VNWFDIVILCLVGVGLVKGFIDGAIRQIVALVALVLGIYLSAGAAGWLREYLTQLEWFPEQLVYPASYFMGFVLIVGVILLGGYIIHKMISVTPLGLFNKILGGVLGLALMLLFISFLLHIIELFDTNSVLIPPEIKSESRFYDFIKNIIPTLPGNLFNINTDNVINV